MARRRILTTAIVVALASSGCGDGGVDQAAVIDAEGSPPPATAPGAPGPRRLPATVVPIDAAAFPRPAAEACADNPTIVDVAAGESIAAAVDAAVPGTTIRVADGTYREQPDEWRAMQVATDDVCIRATGAAVIEAASGQTLGLSITGDDVVVEGLVLRGFETGIAIDGRDGETQRRLTIERTTIEDLTGEFREGVIVFGEPSGAGAVLDGLLVLDVLVAGADLGVSCNLGPCDHLWIEQAAIHGRGAAGGSGADAFAVEEGRQVVLVDSVFTGAFADGIDTKAGDVVVFGARVYDVGRNGIKLWRGGDVINTIVDGTGADAALVGEEPGTYRYVHSLFAHHGEPGDTGYVGTWSYDHRETDINVEIVNSIFYDNASGGLFVPDGAAVAIRNTIFTGEPDDKLLDVGDARTYLFSDLAALESAGFGTGNLIADPQFVDIAGHDYATAPTSPARDAGGAITGLDVDAMGGPRQRGAAPDIGPVES